MNAVRLLALVVAVLVATPLAAGPPGQVTVAATWISGDWGTGVDSDRQSAVVHFVWGDKTRLTGGLEFVSVRSDGAVVVQTPFGPVSTGRRSGSGAGPGPMPGSASGSLSQASASASSGPFGPGTSEDPIEPPGEPQPVVLPEERFSGLGDARCGVERTLLGGDNEIFGLDVELGFKIPTADKDEYLGTGEWDYRAGLAARYELWSGSLFGGLGWNRLGDPPWAVLEDVLDAYVGVASDPLKGGIVVAGWVEGNQEVVAGTGARSAVGLSVRSSGRQRWWLELTAGLGGSSEDFSAIVGVSFGTTSRETGRRGRGS